MYGIGKVNNLFELLFLSLLSLYMLCVSVWKKPLFHRETHILFALKVSETSLRQEAAGFLNVLVD